MKQLLLPCVLSLTACAPIAQLAQPGEVARLTQEGLSLLVSNPGAVLRTTGDHPLTGVLTVDGMGLVPDDQAKQWCALNSSARWDCDLPEIKAGERVRVTFTSGVINHANFIGYRAGKGAVPVILPLK